MAKAKIECLETVRRFRDAIKKSFPFEAVYLFGSRARGQEGKDSDIDIVVISKHFESMDPLDRLVLLGKIAWRAGVPEIEAIGFTPEEFYSARPWEFASEVKKSAVPLP